MHNTPTVQAARGASGLRTGLRIGLFLASLACAVQGWAAPGVMLRDDSVRGAASATAGKLGTLRKGANVDILGNQGGWTRVQAGNLSGWVRLLYVRRGAASRADYAAGIGSAQGAVSTPHDTGAITATSGLRGLDMVQLSGAKYDAAQLARLEAHAASRAQAADFAARAGLQTRPLAYLPEPTTPNASAGVDNPLSGY
jgi:hypothetical protein